MSPTGYTAPVQKGDVTELREFVLQCARAMGAAIMQRDEPMDVPIKRREPSDYHRKQIAKAEVRLTELRSMTVEEIREAYRGAQDEARAYADEWKDRKDAERRRYEKMLAKVRAWEPPTVEHEGLKDFMVKQLTESIDFDCGGSYSPPVPTMGSDKWWQEQVDKARKDIAYHKEEHRKEVERCRDQNDWVDALMESLR